MSDIWLEKDEMDGQILERQNLSRPSSRSQTASELIRDDKKMKICRVCGDRALSVNFNVVTCESCKAFFRRNALKPKAFRCPFSGVCEINVISRKFCKKCRLRKCFEVGMMKEWIMSDEARLKKRELINTNREKRRTVIMATAAKHGLDTDSDKQDMGDNICMDAQKKNGFMDESNFNSDHSNLDISTNDLYHDDLIIVPKSALIDLAIQCRCPYSDLSQILETFIEIHSIGQPKKCRLTREDNRHTQSSLKSPMCTCNLCSDYRMKVPNLNSRQSAKTGSGQIQLPTLNANTSTLDDPPPNMLSFLAPSFGAHYHAVEYPLTIGMPLPNIRQPPRPQLLPNTGPCPWTESVGSMPTIPLEISPHLFDMVNMNVSIQQTPTLSCPLPIRPMTVIDEGNRIVSHKSMKIELDQHISMDNNWHRRQGNDGLPSLLDRHRDGKLSKIPFTLLPKLQELLDAKQALLKKRDLRIDKSDGMTDLEEQNLIDKYVVAKFLNRISSFQHQLDADKMALLTANHNVISILCQILIHSSLEENETSKPNSEQESVIEKYIKIIPETWRQDEYILLILMAISAFEAIDCQLVRKSVISVEQKIYVELLEKYLECIHKSIEVKSAHDVLLATLFEMRNRKIDQT